MKNSAWARHGSILVFDCMWQTPAKTELWAYEELRGSLIYNPFIEILCFPWATLVDLLRNNRSLEASMLVEAINCAPSKRSLKRATICQHIYAKELLFFFKKLGITDLFWAHKIKNESAIDGINIYPFPLYPFAWRERTKKSIKPFQDRNFLYSFIGAYDPKCYISNIRESIYNLNTNNSNCYISKKPNWYFHEQVYEKQIFGRDISAVTLTQKDNDLNFYTNVIEETRFSLCPSGSGPNTIRFWESLMFKCVPVVLSDEWDPPLFLKNYNIIYLAENNESLLRWISDLDGDHEYLKINNEGLINDISLVNLALIPDFLENF